MVNGLLSDIRSSDENGPESNPIVAIRIIPIYSIDMAYAKLVSGFIFPAAGKVITDFHRLL
jgi:hypothetical protein